jgi:biopolymer transport protein TolR
MKMSRRAKRMDRQHQRAKRVPAFNLVALMDIFTILVFFLLVHSSDVQEIPVTRDVDLPHSLAEGAPRESVIVKVASEDIIFDGRVITSVSAALDGPGVVIEPLREALLQQSGGERRERGEVTIMGDKAISYDLLRKVMATCSEAGFSEVSLAVMQVAAAQGGGSL